jgi:hypothetical protein
VEASLAQTRKSSAVEAILNTVVGYGISILAYQFVMPLLGFKTTWTDSVILVAVFSAISIVRNYFIRRLFANWETKNG